MAFVWAGEVAFLLRAVSALEMMPFLPATLSSLIFLLFFISMLRHNFATRVKMVHLDNDE